MICGRREPSFAASSLKNGVFKTAPIYRLSFACLPPPAKIVPLPPDPPAARLSREAVALWASQVVPGASAFAVLPLPRTTAAAAASVTATGGPQASAAPTPHQGGVRDLEIELGLGGGVGGTRRRRRRRSNSSSLKSAQSGNMDEAQYADKIIDGVCSLGAGGWRGFACCPVCLK